MSYFGVIFTFRRNGREADVKFATALKPKFKEFQHSQMTTTMNHRNYRNGNDK